MFYTSPRQIGMVFFRHEIHITQSVLNLNVRDILIANEIDPTKPTSVNIFVDPGVDIGSSLSSLYSLTIPSSINANTAIHLINNGRILGAGGKGGDGGSGVGAAGGHAILAQMIMSITNNGIIAGGGGGGGGGGYGDDGQGTIDVGGGGGGGGAGYVIGGAGYSGSGTVRGNPGNPGTPIIGGAGAAGFWAQTGYSPGYSGPGGKGGDLGQPGSNGSNGAGNRYSGGGAGGAAGNAVVGSSHIVWKVQGDVRGSMQ